MLQLLDAAIMAAQTTNQCLAGAGYDWKCSAAPNAKAMQCALQFLLIDYAWLGTVAEGVGNARYKTRMGASISNEPKTTWARASRLMMLYEMQGVDGCRGLMGRGWMARGLLATSWSSSLKRDSLITAERDAPMPPVFMHSSTMMHLRVFFMLFVMVSRSKGFRLIRSTTCTAQALSRHHHVWI